MEPLRCCLYDLTWGQIATGACVLARGRGEMVATWWQYPRALGGNCATLVTDSGIVRVVRITQVEQVDTAGQPAQRYHLRMVKPLARPHLVTRVRALLRHDASHDGG